MAVDSHVHLYHWKDLTSVLDRGRACLTRMNGADSSAPPTAVLLVLAEPAARNTFGRLKTQIQPGTSVALSPQWLLAPTGESLSISAKHIDGSDIFLISGQQVVTREKLEVLSIATGQTIPDGLPLKATLDQIVNAGGFPILPWGVGKWLFGRGKIINSLIRENTAATGFFALGDNGGRPRFWRRVEQFEMARSADIPIISGSDPLPCGSRRQAAASFGTLIRCSFDRQKPAASLLAALTQGSCDTQPFGDLARPLDFFRDQLALRFTRN